jgi:pimeloyl-ACP methyl ester carboxylesterase
MRGGLQTTMQLAVHKVSVFVKEQGSGTPTLFLHGNPDSADLWDQLIELLSPKFRCLAPDLPGFGRSPAPADFDCSLENMASFVDGLVQAIGITERLNLVVHDFGGPYGFAWAIRRHWKVKRIAAINTLFFSDYRWHPWARIWRTPLLGEVSMALMNRWLFTRALRRSSPRLPVDHIREVYARLTPPMKRMILRLYRATDPENFTWWEDHLRSLTARVPALVLWGDQDPYIPKRFADRFGARQVIHFPAYGHWLPAEAPAKVAEHLLRFFSENQSASN